jgi:NADH:ubiquinone oxidoreductase subunit C
MNNFKKRFNELIDHLKDDLGKDLVSSSINSNYVKIFVKLESIQKVLLYLRDHPEYRFSQLVNLCGVDYLTSKKKRFEVVYHLLSL